MGCDFIYSRICTKTKCQISFSVQYNLNLTFIDLESIPEYLKVSVKYLVLLVKRNTLNLYLHFHRTFMLLLLVSVKCEL